MPGRVIMICGAETLVNVLLIALSCVNLFRARGFVRLARGSFELCSSQLLQQRDVCCLETCFVCGEPKTQWLMMMSLSFPVHDANVVYPGCKL